jgi:hypothetical protein
LFDEGEIGADEGEVKHWDDFTVRMATLRGGALGD